VEALDNLLNEEEGFAMNITTIGLDIAKDVFQVHGVDAYGKVALRKQLKRTQALNFFASLFAPLKSTEQQDIQMLHRVRSGSVKERTAQVRTRLPEILEDDENGLTMAARQVPAWLGRVLKQDSSGGKPKLRDISSKRGDVYLRTLLNVAFYLPGFPDAPHPVAAARAFSAGRVKAI
jgi:transposase